MTYSAYILCTSPRSGSTLLCGMLAATGQCGAPESYFHRPTLTDWLAAHHLPRIDGEARTDSLRRVLKAAVQAGRGNTDLFGLRLQRHSFAFFVEQLGLLSPDATSDRARIEAAFGRTAFVYLTRRDKIAQAISYVIAEQSGLWHRGSDGGELERVAPGEPLRYDAQLLIDQISRFETYDRAWREWFSAQQITPLVLQYENLSNDPQRELARCLETLGRDPVAARGVAPHVSRLSDATSVSWARRLRESHPDLSARYSAG